MTFLTSPSEKYKQSYIQAQKERVNEQLNVDLARYSQKLGGRKYLIPHLKKSFKEFLMYLDKKKNRQKSDKYPSEFEFWLINNNQFIGLAIIRKHLTPKLKRRGGHITYYIRPTQRKKGFGKILLKKALIKAKEIGLKKVLLTTSSDNYPSQKIIISNKGIIDLNYKNAKPNILYFWIKIK